MVLVLAKYGKISNVQATRSAVTAVLKRPSQLSGKIVMAIMRKLSQLSGKAVTAIMKKLSQLLGKAVPTVRKSCLLWVEDNEVRWVLSDCWEGHSTFTLWIWLKNGKISLKVILLFWV